jgi:hypothetical protein
VLSNASVLLQKDITASVSFSESEAQMKDEFMRIIGM